MLGLKTFYSFMILSSVRSLSPLIALSLLACNAPPSQGLLEQAELGAAPANEAALAKAQQHLAEALHDSATAQVVFGGLKPGWYRTDDGVRYAWDLEACVDDVNEFGLREGARIHHFFFLGEDLVAVASPAREWYGRNYRDRYRIVEFGSGGLTQQQAGFDPKHRPFTGAEL